MTGNPREEEHIALNELEQCALKMAFTRNYQSYDVENVLSYDKGLSIGKKEPLVSQIQKFIREGELEITPELAAIYSSMATTESRALNKERKLKLPQCGHATSEHLRALDSLTKLLEKSPFGQAN